MYKLQPIALTVEGQNRYRVRFQSDAGEVEYTFTAYGEPFLSLECDFEFLEITNGDPAADVLKGAICNFHKARDFQYTAPPEKTAG
jgi:hypothetical protein